MRGSTACHGEETARYGGNTSCVSVDAPDQPLILFDLGTGSRYASVAAGREVICLVTHLHWDHIQGLPFFPPMLDEASGITV
ncbi:MAG: MBL fold metallo-hydrolase, partial [Ilumatobacteraceae bacterium]